MDKRELERFIWQEEKRIEKARNRRGIKATLGFSVWYFIVLYWAWAPSGFFDMLGNAVIALILGFFHLLINSAIFYQIDEIVAAENKYLEELRNKLNK